MTLDSIEQQPTMATPAIFEEASRMVGREVWEEIHRLREREQLSVSALGRRFDLDRKTVRRCLRQKVWQPYPQRSAAPGRLAAHAAFLRERAPAVNYSAQILFQELVQAHGYDGSYETVARFVRPLRAEAGSDALTRCRFETPPGWQSQIDWGEARVYFRERPVTQHVFVLTLGFSRRGFYCAKEKLPLKVRASPDAIYAGAIGAALWGAFRYRKLSELNQLAKAS